jgi:hypothetical protein
MSIAEGVQARVTVKAYASGAITSNALAVSDTDLVATGGQVMRRTESNLELKADNYVPAEIREDQQDVDNRQGSMHVEGSLKGEYSPATYTAPLEASFRSTWAAAVTASESDFTSVAFDAAGTATFASGDPVAKGYRVGMILRFATLATAANNAKNFTILGFSGSSNRIVSIYPAPVTETADTAFTVTSAGKSLILPSTQATNVNRKFGIEHHHSDLDFTKLFTECRFGGFNINLPATGNATIEHMVRGRWQEELSGGSAPFFTSPTAETTTGIFNAVNGLLRVSGSVVGVVTGLTINLQRNLESTAVVGQKFHPEIHVKKASVSGQITAQLTDGTYFSQFKNETEIDVLTYLTTTSADNTPANTIYLPRIKLTGVANPLTGEAAQIITMPYQALRYIGTAPGIASTTLQFVDTEI